MSFVQYSGLGVSPLDMSIITMEMRDGLAYVRKDLAATFDNMLKLAVVVGDSSAITYTANLETGMGDKNAVQQIGALVSNGFVVMMSKSKPSQLLISRSPVEIAGSAKKNGEYGIYKGPQALIESAQVIAGGTVPAWMWGAGGVIGTLILVSLFRK